MKIGVILSGGTGTRVGSNIPKQYIEVNGKPIISYCMEQIFEATDKVIIVASKEWEDYILAAIQNMTIEPWCKDKFAGFAGPGENRQLSIYNALQRSKEFASFDDAVIIHDAARPFVTREMIERCFEKLSECDGVLPVLPMKDTVYMSENGDRITSLLDRQKLFAGQAPEAFIFGKYLSANERLLSNDILKINGSTEPAILSGMEIAMIPGDEHNYKITSAADLEKFKKEIG